MATVLIFININLPNTLSITSTYLKYMFIISMKSFHRMYFIAIAFHALQITQAFQ